MGADNRASWEVLRRADDELGDMVKILSCAFDVRAGADSIAITVRSDGPEEPFDSWFGQFAAPAGPPERPRRRRAAPHLVADPGGAGPAPGGGGRGRWAKEGRKGRAPADA